MHSLAFAVYLRLACRSVVAVLEWLRTMGKQFFARASGLALGLPLG